MTPEAQRILEVFQSRGIRAGDWIHFTDFGDAIVWEGGRVRDEAVCEALTFLFDEGYLVELNAGLELTAEGERVAYPTAPRPDFGARVYRIGDQLVVKQTALRGVPAEYLIDEQRERYMSEEDDAAIGLAVRDAVNGRL